MKKTKSVKIKSPQEIKDEALVMRISTWLAGWFVFLAIGAFAILLVVVALIFLKVI